MRKSSAGLTQSRRVLIVVQNLPVPFDRRVWLEATTLARAGFQVSVICPKMRGLNAGRETLEDVEIYRYFVPTDAQGTLGFFVEFAWCFFMTFILTVRVTVFGRGFDVLHVCNPPETYWPLGIFWRLFGKVFIFDHHDLSPELFQVKFGGKKGALYQMLLLFEFLTFRTAHVVIATNESHKALAISRGGRRHEDVYIVRSGPDLSRFRMYDRSKEWSQGKRFLIAFLGEICSQDGVDYLIRAMRTLRDELGHDDVHCVLIGSGPHKQQMVRYASELGVTDCCTFVGRVSDEVLCKILSSADIGVDPGPKNSWSDKSTMNKVVEYMFFGLPLVAFDLRETRVSAADAGYYAPANDERAFAESISSLLRNPELRQRMSESGRLRLHSALAWKFSEPPLLAAYNHAFGLKGTESIGAHGRSGGATA